MFDHKDTLHKDSACETKDCVSNPVEQIVIWPSQCSCGHVYIEKYQFNEPILDESTGQTNIGFCWCGWCRTKRMVKAR